MAAPGRSQQPSWNTSTPATQPRSRCGSRRTRGLGTQQRRPRQVSNWSHYPWAALDTFPAMPCLIRSFNLIEGRNTTTRRAEIGHSSPVLGLRPMRSDFLRTVNVPNEDSFTASPAGAVARSYPVPSPRASRFHRTAGRRPAPPPRSNGLASPLPGSVIPNRLSTGTVTTLTPSTTLESATRFTPDSIYTGFQEREGRTMWT